MKCEGDFFEKRESEPKHNVVMVDFLRHGATEYLENFVSASDRETMDGKYPRDLTSEGEREVEETVDRIVHTISPETDIVVLWSSPAWRAQGSEDILRELLEAHGIQVYKDSAIESMRNFDQRDREFMNNLWEEMVSVGKAPELAYARDSDFQEKNEKFESQPEVKKRAERVFNYIRYFAEHANLQGKRLRIIGVSHFEFLNPIIEDIFGTRIEEGEGMKKGEDMSVTFDFDPASKDMKIEADFRGKHEKNIVFDKEKRRFITEK